MELVAREVLDGQSFMQFVTSSNLFREKQNAVAKLVLDVLRS